MTTCPRCHDRGYVLDDDIPTWCACRTGRRVERHDRRLARIAIEEHDMRRRPSLRLVREEVTAAIPKLGSLTG